MGLRKLAIFPRERIMKRLGSIAVNFEPNLTVGKQIRNLLFVLIAGAACAFAITFFVLYNYGPMGHYVLKNALLSPEVISALSFNEKDGKTGVNSKWMFDKIEYSYQDYDTKKRNTIPVNHEAYTNFYRLVAEEKSLTDVPADVITSFNQLPIASLNVILQSEKKLPISSDAKIFQEVQFLYKGDYYRIQLRESKDQAEWIYFYHPHIYNDTFDLFTGAKK